MSDGNRSSTGKSSIQVRSTTACCGCMAPCVFAAKLCPKLSLQTCTLSCDMAHSRQGRPSRLCQRQNVFASPRLAPLFTPPCPLCASFAGEDLYHPTRFKTQLCTGKVDHSGS